MMSRCGCRPDRIAPERPGCWRGACGCVIDKDSRAPRLSRAAET